MNMSMRILAWIFVFILTGANAFAEDSSSGAGPVRDINITVDLGTGVMRGHTTYQIGGDVKYANGDREELHFPLSELKFPLDVYMASLSASAEFKEKWRLAINVKKNITDDAGTMEDSDWGIWHMGEELPHKRGYVCNPEYCSSDSLDIYSESDAELDALIIDQDFRYTFLNKAFRKTRLSFFAGAGLIYENFNYEVSNVDQWYPSYEDYFGVELDHQKVSGKVLTYDIKYYIPYIKAGTSFAFLERFDVEGSFAISPYLIIKDKDNHILRQKESEGELEGSAIMLSVEGRYIFLRHWFLKLALNYMGLYAKGEQEQSLRGSDFATIDQEITSEQMTAMLKAGVTF
jgi:outer membrane protease